MEGKKTLIITFSRWPVLLVLLFCAVVRIPAQIVGEVLDAADGGPVPYASVVYKGNKVGAKCDGNGHFSIERHNGWRLTFSSVGYQTQVINVGPDTPKKLIIRLKAENRKLEEVTVKSKRKTRYSRKNNPAVELMRKVIAAKKQNDIHQHDFFSYNNYQKLSLSVNNLTDKTLSSGLFKRFPWLAEHVETSQYNDKGVLPLSVIETVSEHIYRKDPRREKNIVLGKQSMGLNDLFQTGDIVNIVVKDIFADINIYDDYIMLMRHKFSSPIGRDAIAFYHFYITDTVYVGPDRCVQLDFVPNNQQDFGFRGQLYVLADSSYQVKRCEMIIPRASDVNWVEGMQCMQEFTRQPNGEWLLTVDDMIVELMLTDFLVKGLVTRTTRYSNYDFSEIPKKRFRGRNEEETAPNADRRDSTFWAQHRKVEFTASEKAMGSFLTRIEQMKGYKIGVFVLKALFENYLETGTREKPSKFDVGPINTMISQNFYDGLRLRVSGQTTANLNPHLFVKGYYAHGFRHHEDYYSGELTYSLNRKEYLPQEFPVRNISFSSKRDVALPSDKYLNTDKDNVFSSFKVHDTKMMLLFNTQELKFEYETPYHLRFTTALKTEKVEPKGELAFVPLSITPAPSSKGDGAGGEALTAIRYTEGTIGLRLAPKEKFFNTKQRRRTINKDAWYVSLQHTIGLNNVLGGQYGYNYTSMEAFKRVWLPMSWGRIDLRLNASAQWNKVPFPLLIMPQANLSYINDYSTFAMVNNMEFLNDRALSFMLNWEMGGKLFNRIPLLRKLKCREVVEFKTLWGKLTSKNNPMLPQNAGSDVLMSFPQGCHVMDGKKPYMEFAVGVQNIFNLLQVEYVRRLNYLDLPSAQKHGIRFVINPTF